MLEAMEFEKKIGIEVFLTDASGLCGKLKETPQDFIVDELSIEPKRFDTAKYVIARVRSVNWETNKLIRELSRTLRVSRNNVGFAGTKDKRAVTTQLMSFPATIEKVMEIDIAGVTILDLYTSKYSMKIGRLVGNKFDIMLKQIDLPSSSIEDIVNETRSRILEIGGFPNFFGIQRFGAVRPLTHLVGKAIVDRDYQQAVEYYIGYPQKYEPDSLKKAREYFMRTRDYDGTFETMSKYYTFERAILYHLINNPEDYIGALKQLPKNLLMMFTHAYQSYIFNRIISERMRRNLPLNEPVEGDMVIPVDGKGIPDHVRAFRVHSRNINKISERTKAFKSYVTAVLYGHDSDFAEGEMGEIEHKIIEQEKAEASLFMIPDIPVCSSSGMRKELFSHVEPLKTEVGTEWVRFIFKLFKGSYATTLLREFIKSPTPSAY